MAEKTKPQPEPDAKPEADPYGEWLQLPAIYCDTYLVDVWPWSSVGRLVFGEVTGKDGEITFRASIVMPVDDVRELIESLKESLDAYDDAKKAGKAK